MLNRDFSKPKKDYILKNKLMLIIIGACLLAGILAMSIFGFNATPDFTGCNVVSVNIGSEISSSKLNDYNKTIDTILANNDLDLYSVQVKGDGALTSLEIKYTGKLNQDKINAVNSSFVANLDVELSQISEHEFLDNSVNARDYIYVIAGGLLILALATIFIMFRHNLSYALSMLGASVFSVLALMSIYAIFRFELSSSFLVISIISMLYTIYESSILFENMSQIAENPEYKDDREKHITLGMKSTSTRLQYTSIGLFLIGLLLVIFGTNVSRNIAINFMFAIIVSLFSFAFILPFVYNLTIDKVKLRFRKSNKKDKNNKDSSKNEKVKSFESKEQKESQSVEVAEKSVEVETPVETAQNNDTIKNEQNVQLDSEVVAQNDNIENVNIDNATTTISANEVEIEENDSSDENAENIIVDSFEEIKKEDSENNN